MKQVCNVKRKARVSPCMERPANITKHRSMTSGRVEERDVLADADRLSGEALGYPLNLMCSLYYETHTGGPFHHAAGSVPPNLDDNDD